MFFKIATSQIEASGKPHPPTCDLYLSNDTRAVKISLRRKLNNFLIVTKEVNGHVVTLSFQPIVLLIYFYYFLLGKKKCASQISIAFLLTAGPAMDYSDNIGVVKIN